MSMTLVITNKRYEGYKDHMFILSLHFFLKPILVRLTSLFVSLLEVRGKKFIWGRINFLWMTYHHNQIRRKEINLYQNLRE